MDVTKVSFGWTSIIGYLASAGGAIPVIIKTVEEGQAVRLGGPEKYLAIASIVIGGLTTLVRGLQAHAKIVAGK